MKIRFLFLAAVAAFLVACNRSETTTTGTSETTATTTAMATAPATAPVTDTAMSTAPMTATAPATAANETMATNPAAAPATATAKTPTKTTKTTPTEAKKPAGTPATATETIAPHGGSYPSSTPPPTAQPPAASTTTKSESSSGSASSTALASHGQSIFKSGCTGCHGADASGNTAMGKKNNIPDLRTAAGLSDAELTRIITQGKSPVSAAAHKSKHLSTDQVDAVIAYIRSLK